MCQLPETVQQFRTQADRHGGFGGSVESIDESDISEITDSDLSGCKVDPSPWEPRVRVLITRLIPILKQHLDESCEPRLLALIHHRIMSLLSELFPEEVVQGVHRSLDRDLKGILGSYTSQKLRDCGEELLVDVSDLFFSQVNFLTATDSLQLSYDSDEDGYFDTDRRDQARDDELASATLESFQVKNEDVTDRTFTLPDCELYIEGHRYTEVHAPRPSSPVLSPPHVNVIDLTLSESRPLDENAVSEKSGDFSHSKTVDTVSETSSCTASDLSNVHPPQEKLLSSLPDATSNHVSSRKDSSDSGDLPPFASTCLSQGSFTLLVPNSLQQEDSCSTSKSEFIAEVLSLSSPEQRKEGPSPISVPLD